MFRKRKTRPVSQGGFYFMKKQSAFYFRIIIRMERLVFPASMV